MSLPLGLWVINELLQLLRLVKQRSKEQHLRTSSPHMAVGQNRDTLVPPNINRIDYLGGQPTPGFLTQPHRSIPVDPLEGKKEKKH